MAVIQLYAPSGPGRTSSYVRKGLGGHWAVRGQLSETGWLDVTTEAHCNPRTCSVDGETWQGFTEHWRKGQRGFGALELGSPGSLGSLVRHKRYLTHKFVTLNSVGKT